MFGEGEFATVEFASSKGVDQVEVHTWNDSCDKATVWEYSTLEPVAQNKCDNRG